MVTREVSNRGNSHSHERSRSQEERAQLHLRLQYTVAQILADARSEQEACAGILSTICENLKWQWAAFWIRRGDELRLLGCWHGSGCAAQEFNQISRACAFRPGEGLPGHVWAEKKPIWVDDFTSDKSMPRRLAASNSNLRAAIGIPIIGQEFLGAIELFNTHALAADAELLKTVAATGAQIAQFLERKRAEQALAESKGLFQGIFQGARDAILLADHSGRLIEVNPAATKLLKLTREKLLAKVIWDFLPLGAGATAPKAWAQILETPGLESEFMICSNGSPGIDVEYRITTRATPGVHLIVIRDTSARKQRERSARILAAAGAILGEGVDLAGTIPRVARVAIPEFADWCALDLLGEDGNISRAAIAHADPNVEERARGFAQRIAIDPNRSFGSPHVIRTGQTEFVEVTPEILRQATGEEFLVLVQQLNLATAIVTPLKRQGRTFGALSFWRTKARGPLSRGDVELAEELARRAGWALENARLYEAARQELQLREKADAELKHLNAELEKRIEERTTELRESNSQLESFCYSVSHDLRAPLRSMQGFSHALVEDHGDKLDPEGRDFAGRILSAAEHMDKLLADVLAYSRLSRQELRAEPVNVDEVINDARLQLQNEIKKKGADVQIAACARKVMANRSVLELMITNLLDNGLKFVPRERAPKISVNCERHGDRHRIWVRDNGIGVAREHQQKIFRIFERLHGVETYPGTGVGLALVQKAAERMNGAVGVESTPGEGSAFWIELPCAKTESSP